MIKEEKLNSQIQALLESFTTMSMTTYKLQKGLDPDDLYKDFIWTDYEVKEFCLKINDNLSSSFLTRLETSIGNERDKTKIILQSYYSDETTPGECIVELEGYKRGLTLCMTLMKALNNKL